ncbi:hypothetical protein TNCV_4825691 [Trichonephila clavipes]|uniref:Transposase n=1 Tax=Trichonephila clavipes TaxID=2585209 RepID=A0A8X6RMZ2_TRICX|nr:hypothetical protein TNCV_4825691 [Trichonephila clavipes]
MNYYSFREIGSRVGRNQTTLMWICDRWMQEGTTDRRGRSHPPQCTTSLSARTIRRRLQHPVTSCLLTQNHRRLRCQAGAMKDVHCFTDEFTSVATPLDDTEPLVLRGIMVWGDIGRPRLHLRCSSYLHPQPYFNRIMRYHKWHTLFKGSSSITRLLPWPARSSCLSPMIENMWSMVAQRLTQITTIFNTRSTSNYLVCCEHIQSLYELPFGSGVTFSDKFL